MPSAESVVFDPSVDPILCSPFEPPSRYWRLDRAGRVMDGQAPLDGRRESMLLSPVPADDKYATMQLDLKDIQRNVLVNDIRAKVDKWRDAGYPHTTSMTQRLLSHWSDERGCRIRPFFAQCEAIETLIWLREVATRQTPERRELEALSREFNDGIVRHAVKMATGTGKTTVMAMVIAWQTLNASRTSRRRNIMHGQRFLVMTPGITVKDRLAELCPSSPDSVYDEMGLVPRDLRSTLNRAQVEIMNFQAFNRKDMIALGFARSGAKGSKAFKDIIGRGDDETEWKETYEHSVRRVLKSVMASHSYGNLTVLNDEAHHCYLPRTDEKRNQDDQKEDKRASVWFNVLSSLRDIGQLGEVSNYGQASPVYDFSATPMWIDTSARSEPEPFQWVASDFGLMDAIESGLTKVPRVPVDDDSVQGNTVWRNLYANSTKKRLPSPKDNSDAVLPAPLGNALKAQYEDYKQHLALWTKTRPDTTPVMIVVANNINNAQILYDHIAGWEDTDGTLHPGSFPELSNISEGHWLDDLRTIVVHSDMDDSTDLPDRVKKMLKTQGHKVSSQRRTSADALETMRSVLNTVGKEGQPGAKIRCVISVGMLTEGWDARNVSHIVGYRAFSTQLLCEQVTGRALRRTSYDDFRDDNSGLLRAEYAEVVGVPFLFMPSRGNNTQPPEVRARTHVRTEPDRQQHRIVWPQVAEYKRLNPSANLELHPSLVEDWEQQPLSTASMTLLEATAGAGKIIDTDYRRNSAKFKLASEIVKEFSDTSNEEDVSISKMALFTSAADLIDQWLALSQIRCRDLRELLADDTQRRTAVLSILGACGTEHGNLRRRMAILERPALSDTTGIEFWTTLEHIHPTKHSELSHAACHTNFERKIARILDTHDDVTSWARNFQTGWYIPYFHDGVWKRYEPDFIARLRNGANLIVEGKGQRDDKADAAEDYTLNHWIPCVAGTDSLSDGLHEWGYVMIEDLRFGQHQITEAAKRFDPF